MAYQTASGTLDAMVQALATFALANAWTARTPADHRYWSILGYSKDEISSPDTQVDFIGMSEGAGNVISGGTASATSGVAADALTDNGTLWSVSSNAETRWVYDFGAGNPVNIIQVTINFGPTPANSYRSFALEYSDDGTTWYTMKSFVPGITLANETFVGDWTNLVWPLSPDGGDNFIDITVDYEESGTRWTLDGGSEPITLAKLYIGVGRDRLAPLARDGVRIALPVTDIDEWHFFASNTTPKYIHCAFAITYEGRSYWHHLSIGQIDKKGMTHNGVVYASASLMTSYATTSDGSLNVSSGNHNLLPRSGYLMGGLTRDYQTRSDSNLAYRLTQTGGNFPFPDNDEWPDREDTHIDGFQIAPTMLVWGGADLENNQFQVNNSSPPLLGSIGWFTLAHPTTGFQSLGVIPFIVVNDGQSNPNASWCMLGEFPDVRTIRVDSLGDATEISVGAETWMVFPLLRKTAVGNSYGAPAARVAQSGPAGIAYKKVV